MNKFRPCWLVLPARGLTPGLLLQVAVILVDPMKGETEHLST